MVYILKIVYASTVEQEQKIQHLVKHFYSVILPKYYTDQDISKFMEMNFLNILGENELTGTLKESYQIISSLETLIFLIESDAFKNEKYQELFEKNAQILNNLGVSFPFSYKQFVEEKTNPRKSGSIYIKANSGLLM